MKYVFFVNVREQCRDLAERWKQLRADIRDFHRSGLYGCAAYLRQQLNHVFRCWCILRGKLEDATLAGGAA